MAKYKVTAKGYHQGRLYEEGEVLNTDVNFEKTPSWLKPVDTKQPARDVNEEEKIQLLKDQLTELGIDYGKKNSVKALRKLVDEAGTIDTSSQGDDSDIIEVV